MHIVYITIYTSNLMYYITIEVKGERNVIDASKSETKPRAHTHIHTHTRRKEKEEGNRKREAGRRQKTEEDRGKTESKGINARSFTQTANRMIRTRGENCTYTHAHNSTQGRKMRRMINTRTRNTS